MLTLKRADTATAMVAVDVDNRQIARRSDLFSIPEKSMLASQRSELQKIRALLNANRQSVAAAMRNYRRNPAAEARVVVRDVDGKHYALRGYPIR